jgi:hypothetical protein
MTTFEGYYGLLKKIVSSSCMLYIKKDFSTTTGTPLARNEWDKQDDSDPKLDKPSLKVI